MDVKEAVAIARNYFENVFEEEGIGKATLEEIWFDDQKDEWCITMGVRRQLPTSTILDPLRRETLVDYKTVRISDKDGKIVSVKIRDIEAA